MILGLDKKFCFLHIPKTGGTSISRMLNTLDDVFIVNPTVGLTITGEGEVMLHARQVPASHPLARKVNLTPLRSRVTPGPHLHKHSTYGDVERFFSPPTLRDLHVVAIYRDPVSRAVSAYNWMLDVIAGKRGSQKFTELYLEDGKMVDFETALCRGFHAGHPHFLPQSHWIGAARGKAHLIRLENLNAEFPAWLEKVGFGADAIAAAMEAGEDVRNASNKTITKADLSDRARAMIDGFYYEDFRLFDA